MKTMVLRPHDVAVALQLALEPGLSFPVLAERTGLSLGESHNAVKRLERARLVSRRDRGAVVPSLYDFIVSGVPYAFPGELGTEIRGVPTAHSGPPLAAQIRSDDAVVWPSVHGTQRGQGLLPLLPFAPELVEQNPPLYEMLTLVDALRVGQARERNAARVLLKSALYGEQP